MLCWLGAKENLAMAVAQGAVLLIGVLLILHTLWVHKGDLVKIVGMGIAIALAVWLVLGGVGWVKDRIDAETATNTAAVSLGVNQAKVGC